MNAVPWVTTTCGSSRPVSSSHWNSARDEGSIPSATWKTMAATLPSAKLALRSATFPACSGQRGLPREQPNSTTSPTLVRIRSLPSVLWSMLRTRMPAPVVAAAPRMLVVPPTRARISPNLTISSSSPAFLAAL